MPLAKPLKINIRHTRSTTLDSNNFAECPSQYAHRSSQPYSGDAEGHTSAELPSSLSRRQSTPGTSKPLSCTAPQATVPENVPPKIENCCYRKQCAGHRVPAAEDDVRESGCGCQNPKRGRADPYYYSHMSVHHAESQTLSVLHRKQLA